MSIFVVVWHMGGGGCSLICSEKKYLEHVFTTSDFINFHLLLLAVPTFIFISIFLYSSQPISFHCLTNRFKRIFLLLTFWPTALIVYNGGHQGILDLLSTSLIGIFFVTLQAGYTLYYFLSSLIICLFASHLFLMLNKTAQLSVLLFSIVLLTFLPYLTSIFSYYPLSAYWNPLNFFPISFSAAFLAKNKDIFMKNKKISLVISLVLCIIFSIAEWKYSLGKIFFLGQGYALPLYTRTSLLFAVFFIFILALDPRIKSNRIIEFMAKYSLALYCLHPFTRKPAMNLVSSLVQSRTAHQYLSIILTVLSSYSIAIILRKYYLNKKIIL